MEKKIQKTNLKSIAQLLLEPGFDRVLVACHRSPDGDATGSSHALAYALRKLGKQARVFCPDPFGREFSYLTEAEEGLFSFEPAYFVTVDIASPEMLCGAQFTSCIKVALDHHRVNTVESEFKYVDPEKASCGEIVLQLLREMNVEFDRFLAMALYTAVATDTGCFRYSNTKEDTFLAAAFLSGYAQEGDFYRINKAMFETKSALLLSLESYAASHLKTSCDGRLAYLTLSLEEQAKLGASYSDLDTMINVIRQLEGVKACFVAKEREKGVFKVSVRSEQGFDACDFCRTFGGGGHTAAAGCTLEGTETDITARLLEEVERRFA